MGDAGCFRCFRCEYLCAYLLALCAHRAAGALGTRHSPRPWFAYGRKISANSRACDAAEREAMCVAARDCAAFSVVIVRLDRTIQYSGTPMTDRRSRGVLDTRVRASALKCSFHSLIAPLARWFIDVAREQGVASTQACESRLWDNGLDQDGDKLFERAPSAGPCQAAASAGGESSSPSTSGSSNRMMSR